VPQRGAGWTRLALRGLRHRPDRYNSCRNRHCPKCQSSAAQRWLERRQADLLPVEYYHVGLHAAGADRRHRVPEQGRDLRLLFDVAAEVLLTIAADRKHLGARIGATLVLHTWGSALTHHPHVHGIVPGGGLALDGRRWIACRPGFFLPVRVLSRLFRRRFVEELLRVHQTGKLQFYGEHAALADARAFKAWLAPLRKCEWVVYAKRPFAGPQAVLAYLSRYTHRVAISNSRLIAMDERGVTFRWKDYRVKDGAKGKTRHKTMTLGADEFMRRFLLHVLPGASTGSGTTGCWPTAAERPAWLWYASCCANRHPRSRRSPLMTAPSSNRASYACTAAAQC
jgi:hypothetical protein